MPKSKRAPLSENQTEIMNIVWAHGEAGVALVLDELRKRRPLSRNTVQTMLSRLEGKGWLKARKDGNAFVYSAAVDRKQTLGEMVRQLVDVAFGGSAQGLIMTLLEERGIAADEKARIRSMLDAAKARPTRSNEDAIQGNKSKKGASWSS